MYFELRDNLKKIGPLRWVVRRIKIFFWKYKEGRFMTLRLCDVCMMIIMLHIKPERVFKFSTKRRLLPKGSKYSKSDKKFSLPDKVINQESVDIPQMDEISIIMRGSSFDLRKLKDINHPIFFVNYNFTEEQTKSFRCINYVSIKTINHLVYKYNLDATYVFSVLKYSRPCVELRKKTLFLHGHYLDNNYKYIPINTDKDTLWYLSLHDQRCKTIPVYRAVYPQPNPVIGYPIANWNKAKSRNFSYLPIGSGLVAISALYHFTKKINIYGWDFHLNSSPSHMGYWELLFNSYNYNADKRSFDHFESAIINYYYGYYISKLPNIKVHGYLGQLNNHVKLIDRIERVLFEF